MIIFSLEFCSYKVMVDVFMGGIVKMMVFDQLIFLELLDDKFFISFYVCSLGCLS